MRGRVAKCECLLVDRLGLFVIAACALARLDAPCSVHTFAGFRAFKGVLSRSG